MTIQRAFPEYSAGSNSSRLNVRSSLQGGYYERYELLFRKDFRFDHRRYPDDWCNRINDYQHNDHTGGWSDFSRPVIRIIGLLFPGALQPAMPDSNRIKIFFSKY
jgi:hypothetical protein